MGVNNNGKTDQLKAKALLDYLSGKSAHSICTEYGINEFEFYSMVSEHNVRDENRKLKRENERLKKQLKRSEEDFSIVRNILGKF